MPMYCELISNRVSVPCVSLSKKPKDVRGISYIAISAPYPKKGATWNGFAFDDYIPPKKRTLSRGDFLNRFPRRLRLVIASPFSYIGEEYQGVPGTITKPHAQEIQGMHFTAIISKDIDLDSTEVQVGIGYLRGEGFLTEEEAAHITE